jgi:hypothetical protein
MSFCALRDLLQSCHSTTQLGKKPYDRRNYRIYR